jgi:type IV pilus assembly protein PilM
MIGGMDFKFDKLLSGLLQKKGSDSVAGVDIGGAFAKVVQLHKKGGKAALETYGEIALGPLAGLEVGQATNLSTEKTVDALRDLFAEAKVTATDLVFSIPLSSTLLTVIEMPDYGEDKLKEMIPLEARKYIPTSISEVSLSHWIIPRAPRVYVDPEEAERAKTEQPKVDVLLAAVHNDVIAKYNDIAKKMGASAVSYEIEVFSTIRATLGHNPALTMVIDIGAANTKVAIIEEGIIKSSHLINMGSQDVTVALSRSKEISMLRAEEIKRQFGLPGDPNDPMVAEIIRLAIDRVFAETLRLLKAYHAKSA